MSTFVTPQDFQLADGADITKILTFDLSPLPTSTVRTVGMPGMLLTQNVTMAATDANNNFSVSQTFLNGILVGQGTSSAPIVWLFPVGGGTTSLMRCTDSLSNVFFEVNPYGDMVADTSAFADLTDPTKRTKFDLSGITTGTTRTQIVGNWTGKLAAPVGDGTAAQVLTSNGAGAQPSWQPAPGAGGGDSVTVNGAAVVDADFDDATPAAPGGSVNVKWQKDASSPANISAYLTKTAIVQQGQATVAFGATGAEQATVTVTDAAVAATSRIIASMAYTPTGTRDLDELEMDSFEVKPGNITAGVGFDILVTCLTGYGEGDYYVNYEYAA